MSLTARGVLTIQRTVLIATIAHKISIAPNWEKIESSS